MRRVRFGLCVDRSTAISTRVRLFRLFLLIPCWESQRLIPKRSAGPRATKIGVVSLKALDHHRPNREESAILALNYPPPERTVGEARFRAPVSERHFPISISACRRPVRYLTETGFGVPFGCDVTDDAGIYRRCYNESPMLCF